MSKAPLQIEDASPLILSEIPFDAEGFWRWSYHACVEWPGDMQQEAFNAWEGLKCRGSKIELNTFLNTYLRWLGMTERQKAQIAPPHRNPVMHRHFHRKKARAYARSRLKSGSA